MEYPGLVFSVIQSKAIEVQGMYLIENRQGLCKRLKWVARIIELAVPGLFFGICMCVAVMCSEYERQRSWEVTLVYVVFSVHICYRIIVGKCMPITTEEKERKEMRKGLGLESIFIFRVCFWACSRWGEQVIHARNLHFCAGSQLIKYTVLSK